MSDKIEFIRTDYNLAYELIQRGSWTKPDFLAWLLANDCEVRHYTDRYIKREYLIHGQYYLGVCRNASVARWNQNNNKFYYTRTKWGTSFTETIHCPDDDDGYDLFYPLEIINNHEIEIPLDK